VTLTLIAGYFPSNSFIKSIQCELQISCCSNQKLCRSRFHNVFASGECGQGRYNYSCEHEAGRYIDKAVSKIHDIYPKLRFLPVQVDLFGSYQPTDGNPGLTADWPSAQSSSGNRHEEPAAFSVVANCQRLDLTHPARRPFLARNNDTQRPLTGWKRLTVLGISQEDNAVGQFRVKLSK